MHIVKRLFNIIFVLIAGVGCGQSTTHFAESRLPKSQALSFRLGTVSLQVAHNKITQPMLTQHRRILSIRSKNT